MPLAPEDVAHAVRVADEATRAGSGIAISVKLSSGVLWLRSDGIGAAYVEADGAEAVLLDRAFAALQPAPVVPEALRTAPEQAAVQPSWWPALDPEAT